MTHEWTSDPPHDPETGEVLEGAGAAEDDEAARSQRIAGAQAYFAAKRAELAKPKKRAPREWYTAPDGTRRQRTASNKPAPATDATAATAAENSPSTGPKPGEPKPEGPKRSRPPVERYAAGTWRYDLDSEGNRVRRNLTPDEIREAAEHKAAIEARRAEERALIGQLIPVLRCEGDPPSKIEHVIPLDKRTVRGAELVSCVRPNGSRLRLVGKYWDGTGPSGHRPLAYVSGYVVFYSQAGLPFRTRGVMFERGELRTVAAALLAESDRLDAAEAAGELPDFLQPIQDDVTSATNGQSSNGHNHAAVIGHNEEGNHP